MREKKLDARLLTCAAFVRPGLRTADIGTDHGQLPVWLVRRGICERVIACDLREHPLARAKRTVEAAGLSERIETRLCDGLSGIAPDEIDDIIVAGMGGELIAAILAAAPWVKSTRYRLILQPMTRDEILRQFLCEKGFSVLEERAVLAGQRCYTVMHCAYFGQSASPDDRFLLCGKIPEQQDEAAGAYLQKKLRLLTARMSSRITGREELSRMEALRMWLQNIITEREGTPHDPA